MGVVYLAVQVPNCFLRACGVCVCVRGVCVCVCVGVCVCEAFIQDFTAGGVGWVKGHVSLEMFWKYLLMLDT